MGKNKACEICGSPKVSFWWSSRFGFKHYCSFSCYIKGSKYFFLFFASIFSIGSSLILLAMVYDIVTNHTTAITPYLDFIIPIFTLELFFLLITIYGFTVKIK